MLKNDFFGFPKVNWLHLTGEVDICKMFMSNFLSFNPNVRQAMSQQVFRVAIFCINTHFQSFSISFSHHAVLKFSPRRNMPQHVHTRTPPIACTRHSTTPMQVTGSTKQQ